MGQTRCCAGMKQLCRGMGLTLIFSTDQVRPEAVVTQSLQAQLQAGHGLLLHSEFHL
jgi:hypothetical protein